MIRLATVGATAGSIENNLRYTGREWDAESGLYYYRANYYEQTTEGLLAR